jgi:hypothetical protein
MKSKRILPLAALMIIGFLVNISKAQETNIIIAMATNKTYCITLKQDVIVASKLQDFQTFPRDITDKAYKAELFGEANNLVRDLSQQPTSRINHYYITNYYIVSLTVSNIQSKQSQVIWHCIQPEYVFYGRSSKNEFFFRLFDLVLTETNLYLLYNYHGAATLDTICLNRELRQGQQNANTTLMLFRNNGAEGHVVRHGNFLTTNNILCATLEITGDMPQQTWTLHSGKWTKKYPYQNWWMGR